MAMAQAAPTDQLVLADQGFDPDSSFIHAASPFMIGLVGAVVGMALIAPGVLRNAQLLVSALLIPSLIVSVGLYALSVLCPGHIAALVLDRQERALELVQVNSFATRRTRVAFEDVAKVSVEESYDRDGYASQLGVITLGSGERLALGFAFDDRQADALRRELGLASARRG